MLIGGSSLRGGSVSAGIGERASAVDHESGLEETVVGVDGNEEGCEIVLLLLFVVEVVDLPP